jgi:2,3-bisphosphoglycerate-independent phosphoglycerate mutase
MVNRPKPIVLTVLDGWGYRAESKGNAIALARKPNYDRLLAQFPNTLIHTSGPSVGLPEGQMGNSEVGHLNIGAGRVVLMDITRIDEAFSSGALFHNELLLGAMKRGRERQLHLLGLVSDGGVHSHIEHLFHLLRMAQQNRVERIFVHCFLDGRDTPPHSGIDYLRMLQQKMRELGVGRIASLVGRYYAMDRDNRWERVERAYRAVVHGEAVRHSTDPVEAVRESYEQGVTDEFVDPVVITTGKDAGATPVAPIRDDDAVIFFNFRADRARQMTRAIAEPGFDKFADPGRPKNLFFVAMTQYDKTFSWLKYLFGAEKLEHILAQVFAEMNFRNLRVAETEKYAHVTYFFNGGVEQPFPGEDRVLVQSPKVATYDLKPEMSAAGIAEAVVKATNDGTFDVIIVNFANADMVGHSGKIEPTVRAVETVDACLGEIEKAVRAKGGAMLITADHGNAEMMIDPETGGPHTAHTTNPVPFIVMAEDAKQFTLKPNGSLRDISPTMLGMLGIAEPKEMTGVDLRVLLKA